NRPHFASALSRDEAPMDVAPTPNPVPALAPPTPPAVVNAWPRSAQWATAFLIGVAVTLLLVHSFSYLRGGTRPTELYRERGIAHKVDLNEAEYAELRQLHGIGDALARRILEHRTRNGSFQSVDELRRVSGIGPAILERLRPWVYVASPPADRIASEPTEPVAPAREVAVKLAPPASSSGSSRPVGKKEENLKERIDINRADLQELQRLPGIGPRLAQRILDERAKRPFQSVDDLRRVSGIGPKTLERLRPYVTVGTDSQRVAQAG